MQCKFELSLTLALLLQGCPSESKGPADGGANDAGTSQEKVGTFTVRLVALEPASGSRPGHATIGGTVYDGPQPEEIVWEVDMEQGDCRLLIPRVPFCDPACADAVCVEDDQCQASPAKRSVGTLTVTGLKTSAGASEFQVKPINASYSTPGDVSLPHPPFEEGDEVRVKAPGESGAPAFEVAAKGIAPLEVTTDAFPLRPGMPLALAWNVPSRSELGRIEIKLDISHHGGTKGKIECKSADSGSLSISAGLISKLLDLGVSGFPTITVTRVNRGSVSTGAGSVELQVVSDLERGVDIEGLVSCAYNSDCEAGKTCQADLACK